MSSGFRRKNSSREKKARKPRPVKMPVFLDRFQQFDEMDRLFLKLSNGGIEYQYCEDTQTERPVLMSKNGNFFDVCSALEGWLELWREVANLHKFFGYNDVAMVVLNFKLRQGLGLDFQEVLKAVKVLDMQKTMFEKLDRSEISRISRMVQERMRDEEVEAAHG